MTAKAIIVTTRTTCSKICETAVGVISCSPWKYPRSVASSVAQKTAGERAKSDQYALWSRTMPVSTSHCAPKKSSPLKRTPVMMSAIMEIRKTFCPPK